MQISPFGLAGLFILELLLLFFLSKFLHQALGRLFISLTKNRKVTIYILAILFLPGTIVHELAHILVAGMMLVPVGNISIFPEIEGDEVRLGSAEVGQTGLFRRTIIGIAPFLVGVGVVISTLLFAQNTFSEGTPFWQEIVVLLVVFEVCNTMFSSKKDMEGAVIFMIVVLIIFLAGLVSLYVTGLLPLLVKFNLPQLHLEGFFQMANKLLLIPLVLDLVFVGLMKLLNLKAD